MYRVLGSARGLSGAATQRFSSDICREWIHTCDFDLPAKGSPLIDFFRCGRSYRYRDQRVPRADAVCRIAGPTAGRQGTRDRSRRALKVCLLDTAAPPVVPNMPRRLRQLLSPSSVLA